MTTDLRCPTCGSLARPDAGWCSLCHEDLRSEEEKAAARAAQAEPEWEGAETGHDDAEPSTSETSAETGPAAAASVRALVVTAPRGRHARPSTAAEPGSSPAAAPGPYDTFPSPVAPGAPSVPGTPRSAVSEQADAALAEAGVDVRSMLELLAASGGTDPLGPLSGRLESKGSRAVVVLVAATGLTAVALLAMFVLGSFVH